MAELLANISCCFDASKDIGETSVEMVACDCKVSKRCCLKWETFTYCAAMIFSAADFIADVFGYISFVDLVADTSSISIYIKIWLICLIISGILMLSEISLPIYSLHKLSGCCGRKEASEEQLDSSRQVAKYWSRFNNISVVFMEDGLIAMVKILIAFKSIEAVDDLQTRTGIITSAIAFGVTMLRHFLLLGQIISKLARNGVSFSKSPSWEEGYCSKGTSGLYTLFIVTLFLSCASIAATGMSMAIAAGQIDIHLDDNKDFKFNIALVGLTIPGLMIVSVFIIIQTRW